MTTQEKTFVVYYLLKVNKVMWGGG